MEEICALSDLRSQRGLIRSPGPDGHGRITVKVTLRLRNMVSFAFASLLHSIALHSKLRVRYDASMVSESHVILATRRKNRIAVK